MEWLYQHPCGVDQVIVRLLLYSQDPVFLGSLVGDHQRNAGQIPAGSLVALVGPDADPVLFRDGAVMHGFGPPAKRHRILPEQHDVAGGSHEAFLHPDYHPVCVDVDVGVVGELLLLSRVSHAPEALL